MTTRYADLLREQSAWLAPMRARLLRRVAIGHRACVLDLGTGYGVVTEELARRSCGRVIALDIQLEPLFSDDTFGTDLRVCGNGAQLPFADEQFDLVFCQLVLMWVASLQGIVSEIKRVLQPAGVVIAFEPDYGGMIEYPPSIATREIWERAITRSGGNPHTGRILPSVFVSHGFDVRVDLFPELSSPSPTRFDLLRTLPLTHKELATLRKIEQHERDLVGAWATVVHVPFMMVTGEKK